MISRQPLPDPPVPGLVPARVRTVYVVTHPEATHHVDGLVGGQFDSELTASGGEDAARIAGTLRAVISSDETSAVVTSDLRRTIQTARAVGDALGVEPELDRRLREKSYGVAGGRDQSWLDERFIPVPAVGDRLGHHDGIDGSESRLEVACRVYEAMTDALRANDVDNLVIVTHGFAATFVVAAWIGMPIEAAGHVAFAVKSGSVTTLREDDFFHNRWVSAIGSSATWPADRVANGRATFFDCGDASGIEKSTAACPRNLRCTSTCGWPRRSAVQLAQRPAHVASALLPGRGGSGRCAALEAGRSAASVD